MEARLAVLSAVADALFPPVEHRAQEAAAAGDELAAAFFRHRGAEEEVLLKVVETVETRLPADVRRELHLLLRLLGSRLGSLLLLGRAAFSGFGLPSAFPALPRPQREAVLLSWAGGSDPRMRKAFKALKALIGCAQLTYLSPSGGSELLAALRYPVTDPERPPAPAPAAVAAEAAVAAALVDLSAHDSSPGSAAGAGAALAAKGLRVMWPGDAGAVPAVAREPAQLVVQCDVVIVGSGAGGGPAAANLATAGLRVVVLEKAGLVPAQRMTLQEGEAFQAMYEQGGILSTEDGAMSVLAGATLGGGTRVNWCASFRTPPHVRREWAEEHGLPDFATAKYDDALAAVYTRCGVHTGTQHGALCSTLASGLTGLGVHCQDVPRNCADAQCSGHCCFGCARGHKQDSVNTWLADACRAGARVITGAWADRVVIEPAAGGGSAAREGRVRRKRAVGVLALAGSAAAPLRIAIQAPVVISSAGSLHSPALLQRSRVTCGGNVGANLRLHPCTCVVGVFPPAEAGAAAAGPASPSGIADMEDLGSAHKAQQGKQASQAQQAQQGDEPQRRLHMLPATAGPGPGTVRPWEGAIMSVFSNHAGDWEGSGYGSLLYTPAVHPGLFAAAAPWLGGEDYKSLLLQYPNACTVLVLTRDSSGAGRVVADRTGRPRIHYTLAPQDEAAMMKGVELAARCMAAAGASAVTTLLNAPSGRFLFSQDPSKPAPAAELAAAARGEDPAFEAWLAWVKLAGAAPLQMAQFSAHQMGTCRLGSDPGTSVLDPTGECWEVAGLYCMDGSTFPTPTGLNPMITIEAISYMLSKQLGEKLAAAATANGGMNKGTPRQPCATAAGAKL